MSSINKSSLKTKEILINMFFLTSENEMFI